MSLQTLLVKASDEMTARSFATERGFRVSHVLSCFCPTHFAVRVQPNDTLAAKWFSEPKRFDGPQGYPYGTLMWYK